MSFGVPGKHGKFYAGRTDDTPNNHVLLWRAQVKAEHELMERQSKLIEQREQAKAAEKYKVRQAAMESQREIEARRATGIDTDPATMMRSEAFLKRAVDQERRKIDAVKRKLTKVQQQRFWANKKAAQERVKLARLKEKLEAIESVVREHVAGADSNGRSGGRRERRHQRDGDESRSRRHGRSHRGHHGGHGESEKRRHRRHGGQRRDGEGSGALDGVMALLSDAIAARKEGGHQAAPPPLAVPKAQPLSEATLRHRIASHRSRAAAAPAASPIKTGAASPVKVAAHARAQLRQGQQEPAYEDDGPVDETLFDPASGTGTRPLYVSPGVAYQRKVKRRSPSQSLSPPQRHAAPTAASPAVPKLGLASANPRAADASGGGAARAAADEEEEDLDAVAHVRSISVLRRA